MTVPKKNWLFLLLTLALLRGSLYALSMPPWGLLDEEQHFDYVLKVAETGRPPVTGKDLIDPRIAQSVFDTRRHERFHWPTPASSALEDMGVERHSYEGYQGPVFYFLAAPFYRLIGGTVLDQLFGLRLLMVLWSLVTVWAAVRMTMDLFPEYESLPYWVGALIVCLPERTGSTGRLTNDVLLEIVSILFLWVFTRAALRGITWKNALLLGLLAGAGFLTKISFAGLLVLLPILFLLDIHKKGVVFKALLAGVAVAAISAPFLLYSYRVYGELTGFQAFADLYDQYFVLWNPIFTLATFLAACAKMFSGFWVVWWNGAAALYPPLLLAFWGVMFGLTLLAAAGFVRLAARQFAENRRRFWVLASYVLAVVVFLVLTGVGYYQGKFPVIQGRFLLPVLFPIALILCLGLWEFPRLRFVFWPVCLVLLIVDAALLFGNLLPFHYYFSAFFQNGQPVPGAAWHGWRWAADLFLSNFSSDKPAWVMAGFWLALPVYLLVLLGILIRQVGVIRPGIFLRAKQGVEG